MGAKKYDHPDYLVTRTRDFEGAFSASSADSTFSGPSLRVYAKAEVLGVTIRIGSGGSAAGTNSIMLSRAGTSDTLSVMQTKVFAVEAGASAAGDIIDINMTTPFTLASMGMAAVVEGNAASLDKVAVLSSVQFRYRLLPFGDAVEEGQA